MEYGNGIMGDMCIHMLDMVRWMLDLGWPKRISSTGGILVDKDSKANITDTQTATFDFGDLTVVWQHRTWGAPGRPEVSLGGDLLRRQGDAQGERQQLRLHPAGRGQADPRRRHVSSWRSTPRTRPRRTWSSTSPRRSAGTCTTSSPRSPRAGKPVADIEQGHISTASCILANLSHAAGPDADLGPAAPARSSATTRRTGCWHGRIAGRGSTRSRRRPEHRNRRARSAGHASARRRAARGERLSPPHARRKRSSGGKPLPTTGSLG